MEDALRINASAGYGTVKMDFFGIGNGAGNEGFAIPIEQAGYFLTPEVLYRVWDQFYLGLGFRYINLETTIRAPGDHPSIPEIQLDIVTSGIRLLAQYDTRDNALNAHSGTFFELNSNFARRSLGGTFSYEQYSASYNKYVPIAENMVIAIRVSLCHTSNAIPFFDLCLFGNKSDLRGYITGQYRDRNLVAAQAEYRWQFYERFGMVAFAGIGSVAPKIDEFNTDNLLPSTGFGLRFMASEDHRVNIGIDYAFGRESQALYFRIGEAF
jgi:outer membrane protein assembly factor BamA